MRHDVAVVSLLWVIITNTLLFTSLLHFTSHMSMDSLLCVVITIHTSLGPTSPLSTHTLMMSPLTSLLNHKCIRDGNIPTSPQKGILFFQIIEVSGREERRGGNVSGERREGREGREGRGERREADQERQTKRGRPRESTLMIFCRTITWKENGQGSTKVNKSQRK